MSNPASTAPADKLSPFEMRVILLVAVIQFINILDFMMVMPLGPDFSRALGIEASKLGIIAGSYTGAAFVSGLAGAFFLDRFDRRSAMTLAMMGLVIGTALGGFATDFNTLVAARVVAGLFGGPATSVALSIIADVVPPSKRGRAMGIAMMSFSLASVLGVPAGLKLALWGTWKTPFFAVAAVGLVTVVACYLLLPPLRGHLDSVAKAPQRNFGKLLSRPLVLASYGMSLTAMVGVFILVPNISSYVQFNLGFPRENIELFYMSGGLTSFVAMPFIGKMIDRVGSLPVAATGWALFLVIVTIGFVAYDPRIPIILVFTLFMLTGSLRNAPAQAVSSKVPEPHERAQFMSLQSAVQHFASAAGAFASSQILVESPSHALIGIEKLAYFAMFTSTLSIVLLWVVEGGVKKQASVLADRAKAAQVEAAVARESV